MMNTERGGWLAACGGMTERDRRNARRLNLWTLAWMGIYLAVLFGVSRDVLPEGPFSWTAIAVASLLGLAPVLQYGRFLREADELLRQIHLQALAFGFGGGMIAAFTLDLLEAAGLPDVEGAAVILAMGVCYLVGLGLAWRRYR